MKNTRLFVFLTLLLLLTSQAQGDAFFLLSDAAYGSGDTAAVRLEAQDMGAISEAGGVDIYVYQVKQPLEFLQAQKNLHRINVEGNYTGEGLSNALARIWDKWWTGSRRAWRKLFSHDARTAVTAQTPGVRTHPLVKAETPQTLDPQYLPLKEHTLIEQFRYPVHLAHPIEPPAGVALAGSSSGFIAPTQGNVLIPIGKRSPGLYLVEAMVGKQRAVTLVFISDSIAVTKVSSNQMLVWVANRRNGKPVENATTLWSDGVGELAHGKTNQQGIVTFNRTSPEKTYVYGEDANGGVFIAENYYYDSEIYNTKIYAFTDRPLYRPGDTVYVKFIGRTFRSAIDSVPIESGELKLQVFDANGFPVAGQTLQMTPKAGGNTRFQLPDKAMAGGYELRYTFHGNTYSAAFRVAEYQKPHFEINVLPEKHDFKTGDAVTGKLQLVYPDGKPVVKGDIQLSVRVQRLSMIEGDLGYTGQFPVKLTTDTLITDKNGMTAFSLPAAREPSRYILTVLATDGAAYRVRATKEILVERAAGTYAVKAERAFSAINEAVFFSFQAVGGISAMPVSWDWLRLEDRQKNSGKLADSGKFSITFATPGTYTVSLRDASGNIVGATSHYVSGGSIGAPQGSIEMLFDKKSYSPDETATALITFSQPVDQALFTLERDKVEKTALMTDTGNWLHAKRLSPLQWRVEIPVQDNYGPNITFSIVYVKGGDYVFQNLGLKVEQPRIEVAVHADKPVYAPGDRVKLDLTALIGAKPATGSELTISVVDEMVYVLQPEIAPNIFDFFYHPRRNNVRTSASLSFISYDLAREPSGQTPLSHSQTHQRALKVLERPRREDKDTAFWQPDIAVDNNGHAQVSFIMPDSLTRWRIIVRAATPAGLVGQSNSNIVSSRDFYLKWTSPNWMRAQDAPVASIAIFNQLNKDASVEFNATNLKRSDSLTLKPGANFVKLPLKMNDGRVDLNLTVKGRVVDALTVPIKIIPANWQSTHSFSMPLLSQNTPVSLPADAANIQLQLISDASERMRRVMDDLIDYPYGCVEQTSSRIIPYSLALQSLLPTDTQLSAQLSQRLHNERQRLAQLAGPRAVFGWWSQPEEDGDAFLTTYAYYADWYASRALKLELPPGHFDRLLDVYSKNGVQRSFWHRALMLYWMQEMGLPIHSLAVSLGEELAHQSGNMADVKLVKISPLTSIVMGDDETGLQNAMSTLLTAYVAKQGELTNVSLKLAAQRVEQAKLPLGDALLLLTGRLAASNAAGILEQVRAEYPTIDRSLTLLWVYRALGGVKTSNSAQLKPVQWQLAQSQTGQPVFHWSGAIPSSINLTSPPAPGTTAVIQYESRAKETSALPVRLLRHLYRLVKIDPVKAGNQEKAASSVVANSTRHLNLGGESTNAVQNKPNESEGTSYALELLSHNAVLKTDEVYLDEIVLEPAAGSTLRFGIVEVPLPPGISADRTTWGINVQFPGSQTSEALEHARYELTPQGYAVPVDTLKDRTVIRHLLRAAQAGKFVLPPARYYRMYQPEQKAFEENARATVEIR
jgi:hypothetical protein